MCHIHCIPDMYVCMMYMLKVNNVFSDTNEVPLCELALTCDNLLCDAHGRPPSPFIVIYVKYSKGLCIKYGTTEIIEVDF